MNRTKKISSFLIPSIVDIIFISLFLLLAFSAGKDLLGDVDTGYHIRAGEYILNTFSIPKNDIFSFITPTLHWTAHEWLSEVIMALVHKAFGLTGVALFFAFIISLVYYLLYKMIKTDKDNIILTTFIILLVLISSQIHWLARPHIFSLLLTLIWYYLLDQYQYHHKNYLYLFPLIMLLWVNLHGGYLAGFVLIGIYLFGNGVQYISAQDAEKDINLYVNSPGGIVTAGLAIYDTIQFLKCDVTTYCVGQAASMGAVLLAAGAAGKRFALPNARIMIHQPLGGAQGQATDIEIQAQEILRLKDRLNEILAYHTGKSKEQIAQDTDRDNFKSADEAMEYGLIDEVVNPLKKK